MKQIIQSFKTGEMEIAEVPIPQCLPNGVLVKTIYSLISAGTEKMLVDFSKKNLLMKAKERPDLVKQVLRKMQTEGAIETVKKVFNKLDTPIPLGYSASGIVVEVGKNIKDLNIGDRVAIAGAGYANHAEFNYVPRNLVNRIPDNVSFEEASFTTVASIGLQGIRKAAPTLGERVAVLGLGLIGQLTVMMLKANGCKVIGFDPDSDKVELAYKNGIDLAVNKNIEDEALNFSEGYGVDSVIITAATNNNAPIVTAGEIVKHKGVVVMVGMMPIDIPRDVYYKKELEFKMATSYGPGRYDPTYEEGGLDYPFAFARWTEGRNMQAVLEMMESKIINLEHLKTHNFKIENAKDAYQMINDRTEKFIGVLLNYPENSRDITIPEEEEIILSDNSKKKGKLNIAYIGCGNFAQSVLMPSFSKNKNVKNISVVSKSGYSAYSSAKKFKIASVYKNVDEVVKSDNIDAVVISTRHNLHFKQIKEALENNLSVFVEKPLVLIIDELKELKKIYKNSGAVLQVGFNRRFSPLIFNVKKKLSDNLPKIINYDINAGVIPNDVWVHDKEIGGGRIIGEVCHFVDLISSVTESFVESVYAVSISSDKTSFREDDNFSAVLKMTDGSVGYINYHAMGGKSLPKEKIVIHSGSNSFVVDNFKTVYSYGKKEGKDKSLLQEKGFREEVNAFVNAVKTGNEAISFDSIVNTTLVTFAIEESLKTGKIILIGDLEKLL